MNKNLQEVEDLPVIELDQFIGKDESDPAVQALC